jgi:hypothetical protein
VIQNWQKLENESEAAYQAFLLYLGDVQIRASTSKIAEASGVRPTTVSMWKSKYSWAERAEAYDRSRELEVEKERGILIKEHAYKLNKDLMDYINLLNVAKSAYEKKLKDGGLADFGVLSTLELRRMMNEDVETAVKLIKVQKEVLSLIPEGREILEEEKTGDKITIIINSVTNNNGEASTEVKTIDVTPKKVEIGHEKEKEKVEV